MTWVSISWKLTADTDTKLLWKKNCVLQIVALTDGIQRQDIVLHTYYLAVLRITWRWFSKFYFFFSISPQVGNFMNLFRKKNFRLFLCQGMVLWLTSLWCWQSLWFSPDEYGCFCPRASPAEAQSQSSTSAEMGLKNVTKSLQGFVLLHRQQYFNMLQQTEKISGRL